MRVFITIEWRMISMVKTVKGDNFEDIKACGVAVADFSATWCGPCKMLSPVIDEIAKEYEGKAKICKVNVDDEMGLAQQYRVMSVPTVLVFKNGQVSGTSIGYVGKEKLTEML